jgi:CheY-like chemotaxis protein
MFEALNGRRLLVVEDEALVAMMVEEMLSDMGCCVVAVAGTLERGLTLANDRDLLLDGAVLDVNLGGKKVYPIAEALAARGVPFIFATGYGLAGIIPQFAGAPVVAKPYDPGLLERTLAAVLGSPESR